MEVHSVTTDVRVRGEVRCRSEWHRIRGIGGIRGGPRRYGDALGHWEPLVLSLLFDPGAPDHRAIIRDLLLRRCIRCRLTYAFQAKVRRRSEWRPIRGVGGHPGRSTMLRRCSGASGAPCYFPVIRSRSPGPSRYRRGPPSTKVCRPTPRIVICLLFLLYLLLSLHCPLL